VERLELRLAVDLPLRRVCRHGCAYPGYNFVIRQTGITYISS
jgi:hypothetical protein